MMLTTIARQTALGRSSLRHCKAFLSGAFKQAKRLGILDGLNPIQDVSIPRAPEPDETYAYNLDEKKAILGVLPQPAWTVVLTAALTGLRKGEIRGLDWEDFSGEELSVKRTVWNGTVNEPKTNRSKAGRRKGSIRPKGMFSSAMIPCPTGTVGTLSAAALRRTCTH